MPAEILPAKASSVSPADWSDAELLAAVEAYLLMLRQELNSKPFVKSNVNHALRQGALKARTKASIEFRMQNISATLCDLRIPRIAGYLPAKNVGGNVKDRIRAVLKQLDIHDLEAYVPTADPNELEVKVRALRKQGLGRIPSGRTNPEKVATTTTTYVRDPAVKQWVLQAANGVCEGCNAPAPFVDDTGAPYLEVHHVMPLAKQGSDRISNAAALCPNCHRRCHSARDRDEFKLSLYQRVKRLRSEVPEVHGDQLQEFVDIK